MPGTPAPMPGANFGGTNYAFQNPGGGTTPAIGSSGNPLLQQVPGGSAQPNQTSQYSGVNNLNPAQANNLGQQPLYGAGPEQNFVSGASDAGIPAGIAQFLFQYLQSGAGYNPQVAQALIQAVQPQAQQAQANLSEQFSAEGLRNSSPAAYGQASFSAQLQDYYAGIFANMYEQSQQNYLNVLLGIAGKEPTPSNENAFQEFGQTAGGISSLATGFASILKASNGSSPQLQLPSPGDSNG